MEIQVRLHTCISLHEVYAASENLYQVACQELWELPGPWSIPVTNLLGAPAMGRGQQITIRVPPSMCLYSSKLFDTKVDDTSYNKVPSAGW